MHNDETTQTEALWNNFLQTYSKEIPTQSMEHAKESANLASENTYKVCDLIITLNLGIITAFSFLFTTSNDIKPFSKFLSMFFILSALSIIFAFNYRKNTVEVNRAIEDKKSKLLYDLIKNNLGDATKRPPKNINEILLIQQQIKSTEVKD